MSTVASTSSNPNPKTSQEKSTTSSNNTIKIKCSTCGKHFVKNSDHKRHLFLDHYKSRQRSKKKSKLKIVENKDQDDLFRALRECPEGEEIKTLINLIQPGDDLLVEIHNRIVEDLKNIFDQLLQEYHIQVFGSTITGLAMKESDFDFFVSVPNLDNLNDVKILIRTLRIEFLKQPNLFSQSIPIYSAKVPLLKLTHALTGVHLDINFSNSFGIYNSNILQKLVKFDYRIKPLVVMLKYWGKIYQVTGTGKITNYSFTLMIIFLLQTLKDPIVPPIKVFQDKISPHLVNNCNFSFNEKITNTTKNEMTVFQLLKEFFCFYSNFNYNDSIICPYLGQIIKRSEYDNHFKTIDNTLFKLATPICVQDPFEQNRNIITSCNMRNSELFIHVLKTSQSILLNEENVNLKLSEILIKLLSQTTGINKLKTKLGVKGNRTDRNNFLCKLNVTQNEVQLLKQFLPTKQGNGKVNFHKMWCNYCVDLLKPILKNIYQMECKRLDVNEYESIALESNKLLNLSKQTDPNYIQIYNIKTSFNLWEHLAEPIPFETENYIELEYGAAKNCQTTANLSNAENLLINSNLIIKLDSAYNFIEINFFSEINDEGKLEKFQSFFKHFTTKIRNYIRGHLYDNKNIDKYLEKHL